MAAAEPQLASALFRITSPGSDDYALGTASNTCRKLATGCQLIDGLLDGGLDYGSEGSLCCISAEDTSSPSELVLSFLASHLTSEPLLEATIIDTTLGFDIRQLNDALLARLRNQKPEAAEDVLRQEALATLDRVQIMKVFDFVGMTESVDEVRSNLQNATSSRLWATPRPPALKSTIADSQGDEEEMLDFPAHASIAYQQAQQPGEASFTHGESQGDLIKSPGLLLITDIAHVASPLLKQNHSQGQAFLGSFMRSLSHLTREQNLCTILLSTTYSSATSKDGDSPSIFSSCNLQPALGRSFNYLLDLHLLLHKVPRSTDGTRSGSGEGKRRGREVDVLEVLQDRYGRRVGRWAAFTTGPGARLQAAL